MTDKPCPVCGAEEWILAEYSYDSPDRYDGTSEYLCNSCGTRWGRWSGKVLAEGESEPRYGIRKAPVDGLREKVAALQHEQWSGWMEYLFSKCLQSAKGTGEDVVIPSEFAQLWVRQMQTPYMELPDNEKESDRIEADKYLPIITSEKLALLERIEKHKIDGNYEVTFAFDTFGSLANEKLIEMIGGIMSEVTTIRNELKGKGEG